MKQFKLTFMLTVLMSMVGVKAYAHDIEAKNADGVTIYYKWINSKTELAVSYKGNSYTEYSGEYSGDIVIPESVTYEGKTYSVTSIGERAFRGCGVTSVTIPNSVKSIDEFVFRACYSLTSITLGNSVTYIGKGAFQECEGLTSFLMPNSLESVGINVFDGCTKLTSITLSNNLNRISSCMLHGCSNLTSIIIPSSVTGIGIAAFENCYNLMTITSYIREPFELESSAFDSNTKTSGTLIVPNGTIEKYKATKGWSGFKNIINMNETPDNPETLICEPPTISYSNGKLIFNCITDGAICHYTITDNDVKLGSGNEVQLGVTYTIRTYASKTGYDDSATATATLCWIDQQPKTEGVTNGVAKMPSKGVLIQNEGGTINVQGSDDGESICVYSVNGILVGSAVSQNGTATVNTTLQPGSVAIIKVGEKSVKVIMK